MGDKTGISWTDATWNPVRGCSRVSEGCRNCYAERVAARFSGPGQPYEGLATTKQVKVAASLTKRPDGTIDQRSTFASRSRWTGAVRLIPEHLADPLRWKRPRRIFVNSMSDLFHEALTNEQIAAVFGVMAAAPQHTFQVLTKRARRMREWFEWARKQAWEDGEDRPDYGLMLAGYTGSELGDGSSTDEGDQQAAIENRINDAWARDGADGGTVWDCPWPLPNVWLGVSVENQAAADERVYELLATPAAVRFLSCEPLLGPVDLSRWLGGSDVRQDQEGRGVRVRGGYARRDGDRSGGSDLASRTSPRTEGGRDGIEPMQASACGTSTRRLSEREGDDRRQAHDGARASDRLVSPPRIDSGRVDDQPQERREGGQPPRESRAGDGLGTASSRNACAAEGPRGESERHEEPRGEVDDEAGGGDQGSPLSGRTAEQDCGEVRSHVPARVGYRAPKDSIGWLISGCESGPGARPCSVEWLRSLRDQCAAAGVPYFLKQANAATCTEWRSGPDGPRSLPVLDQGDGSKRKAGGVIELPYLDGVQHASFPEVA